MFVFDASFRDTAYISDGRLRIRRKKGPARKAAPSMQKGKGGPHRMAARLFRAALCEVPGIRKRRPLLEEA